LRPIDFKGLYEETDNDININSIVQIPKACKRLRFRCFRRNKNILNLRSQLNVSIEFGLNINETKFLFNEIFEFFREKDLKENFINLLCPPIVAGQFRKEYIPEAILRKLFD